MSSGAISTRIATQADLAGLLELEARAFDRPWPVGAFEQEIHLPHAEIWLAFEGDDRGPLAYVDFWVVEGEVSILNVAVDPAAQRRGLGRLMVQRAQDRGHELGGEVVFLEVRRSNEAGLGLYRSMGFEQVGLRKAYYSDSGEDAVVMSKRLDDPLPER